MKFKMFKIVFAVITFSTFFSNAAAQGFRFDDPNVIFKDGKGNTLTVDSAKKLAVKGPVGFQTSNSDDGKLIVVIKPIAADESEKRKKQEDDWINSLKNSVFPEVELKALSGRSISNTDFKDKYVVLNFWFIGCKPCLQEIPELNKLVDKYESQGVVFFAPSLDKASSLSTFAAKTEFKYMILPEAENLAKEVGVKMYPTHILLDREGYIKEVLVGGSDDIYTRLEVLIQKTITSKN
jgi:peroxiredoxin